MDGKNGKSYGKGYGKYDGKGGKFKDKGFGKSYGKNGGKFGKAKGKDGGKSDNGFGYSKPMGEAFHGYWGGCWERCHKKAHCPSRPTRMDVGHWPAHRRQVHHHKYLRPRAPPSMIRAPRSQRRFRRSKLVRCR